MEPHLAAVDEIAVIEPTAAADTGVSPTTAPENNCNAEPFHVLENAPVRTKLRIYSILGSLYMVLFLAALDQTIIATSVPTIAAALHSATGYIWIGGAYVLANTATGPIWARCSDIWGRKPALLGAVAIFTVGSVLAATSVSMRMLIAARALQGAAGGGLMSLVSITVADLFSVRKRALYTGMLGFIWALAGSSGPLIGGALSELASWRWCFWINLPICAAAFLLLFCFLDMHNPRTKLSDGLTAVDWFGMLSMLAVTLLLLLGLDFGGAVFPWSSPKVVCLIVFGTLMIGLFIYSEKRLAKYPLMPLGVFCDIPNIAAFLVASTHSIVSTGIEFYLPLFFQSVKGASALRSGTLIVPMMVTEAAVDIVTGILIHRTGRYREITWVGATLMTLGTGLYISFRPSTSIGQIIGYEIIGGIGTAALFQTPSVAIQSTVSQANTASAIATMGFLRNVATSLSIVVGGVIFQNSMTNQHQFLAASGLNMTVLESLTGDQAAAHVDIVASIESLSQRQAVKAAFAWCLRNMFIFYTCVAAVTVAASTFIKQRHLSTEHTETKTGLQNMTDEAAQRDKAPANSATIPC